MCVVVTHRNNQPYTTRELRHMVEQVEAGVTPAEIATEMGRTTKGVELQLHLQGVNKTKRGHMFTSQQCGRIIVCKGSAALAVEMGLTPRQISSKRAAMKWKLQR